MLHWHDCDFAKKTINITKTIFPSLQPPSPMDQVGKIRGQHYSTANPYSQGQGPPTLPPQGTSYPAQGYGPPGAQRYPLGMQGRTPAGMSSMQYGQQVRTNLTSASSCHFCLPVSCLFFYLSGSLSVSVFLSFFLSFSLARSFSLSLIFLFEYY